MKFYLALLSVLASVALTVAQNCELQAVQIANKAREKLGSTDYGYYSYLNMYAGWFKRKDNWFIAQTVRDADVEGGWTTKGWGLFEHEVPEPIHGYRAWFVMSGGSIDGWWWDNVNCEQPCLGDIVAGPSDGTEEGHTHLGVVTSTNPGRVIHIDDESGELVESTWGFEYFADPEKRKHFVCWRYL